MPAPNPNSDDQQPDFSFLGDDSVSDAADTPDFSSADASAGVPDFSGFGHVEQASSDIIPPMDAGPPDSAAPPPEVSPPPAAAPPAAAPPAVDPPKRASKRNVVKMKTVVQPPRSTTDPPALTAAEAGAAAAAVAKPVSVAPIAAPRATASPLAANRAKSAKSTTAASKSDAAASSSDQDADDTANADTASAFTRKPPRMVSQKTFSMVAGYASALTLLLLFLVVTGRVSPTGEHPLESLPDVRSLKSTEFQLVPEDAPLPAGHALNLGESRRFGDVVLTPIKVTREPVTLVDNFGKPAQGFSERPVLKLWFKLENASSDVAFPPWDVHLMCHRSETEGNVVANSWLMVQQTGQESETQILNFYHSPESSFDILDHHSNQMVLPGQSLTSFIASSEDLNQISADKIATYRWRLQIRKGVHMESGSGVTTLVDVSFSPADIQA